jgi:hypothetical protein
MFDDAKLRALWAGQPAHAAAITLDDVKKKAPYFQSAIRRRNITEYAASILVIGVFGAMAILFPEPVVQAGAALVDAGTLYVVWQLWRQARSASSEKIDAAVSLLDFHRAELARQRAALATVWSWYLLPFVPGILVFLAGVAFTPANPAPLPAKLVVFFGGLILVGVLFGAIGWLNARAVRQLDAEIAALEA